MKRLVKAYFLTLMLLPAASGFASIRPEVDSLQTLAGKVKDTMLVDVFNRLSYQFRNSDINKTLMYADSAIAYARKMGYIRGIGDGYVNKGNYYRTTGDNAAAIAQPKAWLPSHALPGDTHPEGG